MKKIFAPSIALVSLVFGAAIVTSSVVSQAQEVLYGLTRNGGVNNKGVPYQINTDGSGFLSYTDFDGDNGANPGNGARFSQLSSKRFEGTGFDISGLVGLTESGYQQLGYGNRVQIRPGESGLIAPFSNYFGMGSSGTNPTGGFLATPDGTLYGMTSQNGQYGGGTLFSAPDIFGNGPSVLLAFDGVDHGRSPKGTLIRGSNNKLYGTTEFGGVNDLGIIFYFDIPGDQPFRKLIDFDGASKGSNPTGNLLLASDGRLYGMTTKGGSYGHGVLFSLYLDGSDYKKILDFNGTATGSTPKGSLVQFTDGKLYGMTSSGGISGYGTIFSISLGGVFTKIHDFNGINGKSPVGDLLVDVSGKHMYGVAYAGGVNDQGVLFKLQNGSLYTKLYDYHVSTGSNPVGSLVMIRKEADIKLLPIPDKNMLSAPFVPAVQALVDMPVYFISSDPSVVAVENNELVIKGTGGAQITAFQTGNHEYLGVSTSTFVTVKKTSQAIAFGPLSSKTFGDSPFTIAATSTSGLPVELASSDSEVAIVDGNKVIITGGGYVNIVAYQPGNSNYEEAPQVIQSFFVERAVQTINLQPFPPQVCCQFFYVSATASSNLEVKFKTSDLTILDFYSNQAQPRKVGSVEIIAYQPGNRRYKPVEVRMPVEIVKGLQNIFFYLTNTPRKVGDPPEILSAGSDRSLPVTFTSNPPGIAVVEKGMIYFLAAGTTTITATQSGNENYYEAYPVSRTITVNPPSTPGVGNTITFPDLNSRTIVDPPFNLYASATSGLPVSYTSSNPSIAEINGNLVTIKSFGSVTITATQPGKAGVSAANPVAKVLEIKKKEQYIVIPEFYNVSFGTTPIPLPVTSTEGLPLTYTLSDNNLATIENYYLNLKGAGYLTITASQSGSDKYLSADPVSRTFRIDPIYDNVFFRTISPLTYGDAPFSLEAFTASGLPITFSSSDPDIASVVGSTVIIKAAGRVTISASSINPGYNVSEFPQIVVIDRAKQVISIPALENIKFGIAPFIVPASSTSGRPVILTTNTPGVVKITNNLVAIVGSGTAEIVASQPGNENYYPAENVHRKFLVTDVGNTYEMAGATLTGGPNYSGVLFSMNSEGTSYGYLKQFNPPVAPSPQAGFIKGNDGRMYGHFKDGGTGNSGSIVRLEADGTGMVYLYHFKDTDGKNPSGNLLQTTNGDLYGTTQFGGDHGGGTIFRIKPDGTGFTVLYHLSSLSGQFPKAGLVQASNGKLYGIAPAGGFNDQGTIFTINSDGSGFSVIFHLDDRAPIRSGYTPNGELVEGADGFLYGTTMNGGSGYNGGVLFKIKTDGSGFTKIVEFNGVSIGSLPGSSVLFGSDGTLYGMTGGGGANSRGTIFSVKADGTGFTNLFSFDGNNGSFPRGKFTEGADGCLYGMTYNGGANNFGTIFKINKNGTGFHKMVDLDERSKYPTFGPLLESTPGNFFGMTANGGSQNAGAVITITSGDAFSVLNDFPPDDYAPRNVITDSKGEYYYGITQAQNFNEGGSIFKISANGTSYQRIYVVPKGHIITTIFYSSTGHIWASGVQNNEAFMFRMKPDGSERQEITAYNVALAQERKPAITMVETAQGEIFGGTDGNWSSPVFFKIRNDGTGFSKLLELSSGDRIGGNLLSGSDGNFYMAYGNDGIFKFTASGVLTKIFSHPSDAHGPTVNKIIEMNGGRLGIITRVNGSGSYGSIFSIEKDGSAYSKIYEPKVSDGVSPVDMVQSIDGWLYVASEFGGKNQKGVIYKVLSDGSSYTKIREFNGSDGETPNGIFFKRAMQSFTFDPLPEKTTSDPAFLPIAVSTSGAAIEFQSSNENVAVIENGKIKPMGKGTANITAILPANANFYDGGEIVRPLVVEKGTQIITFNLFPVIKLQDKTYQLMATASSGLPVSYQSSSPAVASVTGSIITIHTPGTTTITASQPGNDNFFAASNVSQVLLINNGGAQSIVFTNPGTKVLGTNSFQLVATASSGLPIQFTTTSNKVSINGGMVTMLKAGVVTIVANQPGDSNFDPSIPVQVTFCINPSKPFIAESGVAPYLEFHSSNDIGNQWYLNNSILTGYVSKSIRVSNEGSYTVLTTIDGCASERSDPSLFLMTGMESDPSIQIDVYPNPVVDNLKVEVTGHLSNGAAMELVDAMGRTIEERTVPEAGTITFKLPIKGMFLLRIKVNGKLIVKKIMRE